MRIGAGESGWYCCVGWVCRVVMVDIPTDRDWLSFCLIIVLVFVFVFVLVFVFVFVEAGGVLSGCSWLIVQLRAASVCKSISTPGGITRVLYYGFTSRTFCNSNPRGAGTQPKLLY